MILQLGAGLKFAGVKRDGLIEMDAGIIAGVQFEFRFAYQQREPHLAFIARHGGHSAG